MNQKLKSLEGLIADALVRIKKLTEENRKLALQVGHLQNENGQLEMRFKRFQALGARHEKIKAKLVRLVSKIDKAVG